MNNSHEQDQHQDQMTPSPSIPFRSKARDVAIRALHHSGSLRRARENVRQRQQLIVLTLHRIVPDERRGTCRSPAGMVLRESLFLKLISYLESVATFVSPDELMHRPNATPGKSTRPQVLLTFDDGWLDNAVVAYPHLQRAKIRACFFIATAFAGCPSPFWPERVVGLLASARRANLLPVIARSLATLNTRQSFAPPPTLNHPLAEDALLRWLKQFPTPDLFRWTDTVSRNLQVQAMESAPGLLEDPRLSGSADPMERMMTWNQVRTLALCGHHIGSHTCTHALLPQLDIKSMTHEMEASRDTLQTQLPDQAAHPLWISYPNGSTSAAVLRAARVAGYQRGFSNSPGAWTSSSNPLLLPRVNIWDGTLVDSNGIFSENHLDYALFWRTSREHFTL